MPATSLTWQRSVSAGGKIKGDTAPLTGHQHLWEVTQAALDDLVQPLFRGPETLDVPTAVDLLRIGETKIKLDVLP
jgi:hypothetical protein